MFKLLHIVFTLLKNSSMYAYICILLGKVRTLLIWADELLSKMWVAWNVEWMEWSG